MPRKVTVQQENKKSPEPGERERQQMNFEPLTRFMDYMSRERTPGNAIMVYLGGKCVYRYACGYAELESKTPLTGEEFFNLYSCSKITTVTAGLQLLEKGRFLLTDPLYEYIPEFREMYVKTPGGELVRAKNPITIRDLFCMSAGFSYDLNSPGFQKARALTGGTMDTASVVRCIADDPLHYVPGTRWVYSIAHDVLAGLVSIIEGKKFRDYVKEAIFDPLGIENCVYHHTPRVRERMAAQYRYEPEKGDSFDAFVNVGKDVAHVLGEEYDSGGAGITGTMPDYVKLLAALAGGGLGLNGARILSGGSVELLKLNQLSEAQMKDYNWETLAGYGYGLGVRTLTDKASAGSVGNLGEFGWCGAAGSMALMDSKLGLAMFYVQHVLNPREEYYMPRLRNVLYSCLD